MSGENGLVDLFIIGGGVNGAGIARDAAGRGLKVVLAEKDDLAEGTSSRSGKLVHGGLRYLEYFEFRLIREALIEREVLLRSAPHIIWPIRFVLPHSPDDRPAWQIRLGLFLYDHLGGRDKMAPTRTLNLRTAPEGAPLRETFTRGFEYSDCWVDDSRLVVLNALDAAHHGARILTRTPVIGARRQNGLWTIETRDEATGTTSTWRARGLVNAAGILVNDIIGRVSGPDSKRTVRLIRRSHIVVPKFWKGTQSYLVRNDDQRVIFINPYEHDLAMIGTTDIPHTGNPEADSVDPTEVDYLIKAVNRYFKPQLTRDSVRHSFVGVRAHYDNAAINPGAVTRDYAFELDAPGKKLPLLSIFGGKITTYRKLAEHVLEKLAPFYPKMKSPWTAKAPLPGGNIPGADFDRFFQRFTADHIWAPPSLLYHTARLYGTRARALFGTRHSLAELGQQFGPDLYEFEARFLMEHEWARTAEDILERRTKHGLHLTSEQRATFIEWMERQEPRPH